MNGYVIAIAGCLMLTAILQAQAPSRHIPVCREARLVYSPQPVYPELAKQARIQGTVEFAAIIGETGMIESLRLISGHPLLAKAAVDAVKRWRYRPATCNGQPVAVVITIDVPFQL